MTLMIHLIIVPFLIFMLEISDLETFNNQIGMGRACCHDKEKDKVKVKHCQYLFFFFFKYKTLSVSKCMDPTSLDLPKPKKEKFPLQSCTRLHVKTNKIFWVTHIRISKNIQKLWLISHFSNLYHSCKNHIDKTLVIDTINPPLPPLKVMAFASQTLLIFHHLLFILSSNLIPISKPHSLSLTEPTWEKKKKKNKKQTDRKSVV